jgi:aminomethyltransferase
MKKTVLHDIHTELNARMGPFAGFDMPIQYEGIVAEHEATRTAATVFDTSHMGEFRISGPSAITDLERLVSSHVATMRVGQCRYGLLCNPQGGVVDDEITYRTSDTEFLMVVNAGTRESDFSWISSHLSAGTSLEDVSERTAKLDVQGPRSPVVMRDLLDDPVDNMRYFRFAYNRYRGEQILVSLTGYTGEVGFEVYCGNALAVEMWRELCGHGVKPAGLGARDTLRLEMGLPLYGHELSAERNAGESGFDRSIASDKEFIGCEVVLDTARRADRLVCMVLEGRRAAREKDAICADDGSAVGTVTSGSFAPSLGKAVAMGYVRTELSQPGTRVSVRGDRSALGAVVQRAPLYKEATARKPVTSFL